MIRELAHDEQVAAQAAADLLHRPHVAFKALTDGRARQMVNRAQVERGRQAHEDFQRTHPIAPAVRQVEHTIEFLDLVGACHAFVASAARSVPGLVERTVTDEERAVVHENVARLSRCFSSWRVEARC
ncbi:DUF6192 family protein [Phaeacidiphilus oryzae]|uniref:DUF6192 family protein n=1 Tax=Phaeacidiphilus oryzae TaxID=348818 RepID=UPI000691108A|nr:DUF6192 family protein [Phaeacidiphilus oryzae]